MLGLVGHRLPGLLVSPRWDNWTGWENFSRTSVAFLKLLNKYTNTQTGPILIFLFVWRERPTPESKDFTNTQAKPGPARGLLDANVCFARLSAFSISYVILDVLIIGWRASERRPRQETLSGLSNWKRVQDTYKERDWKEKAQSVYIPWQEEQSHKGAYALILLASICGGKGIGCFTGEAGTPCECAASVFTQQTYNWERNSSIFWIGAMP